jgi:hypothetical protein
MHYANLGQNREERNKYAGSFDRTRAIRNGQSLPDQFRSGPDSCENASLKGWYSL